MGKNINFCLMMDKRQLFDGIHQTPIAASKYLGSASGSRWTAQIKIENKQLKTAENWTKNQALNEVHIPIEGK